MISYLRISYFSFLIAIASSSVFAQSSALLEACNSIENKDKRLICLKELNDFKDKKSLNDEAIKKVKAAFFGISGAVSSGVSYKNYQNLILDPAKELGIFRQEAVNVDKDAIILLESAVTAYKDAERLWRASIYDSQDGGILFGRILNYQRSGLTDVVNKYNLPTNVVLMTPNISAPQVLPIIWKFADNEIQRAVQILDGNKGVVDLKDSEDSEEDYL